MIDRAQLRSAENGQEITAEFLLQLKKALLLALKETGQLDEPSFRYAEKKLREQSGPLQHKK